MSSSFTINTPKHRLLVKYRYGTIHKDRVKVDKELFYQMCKDGCPNFNQKYTCPPLSPDFKTFMKLYDQLFVLLFTLNLDQYHNTEYREYLKLQISNAVLKSKIEKIMRELETITVTPFLGTGSCRLCKPCQKKLNLPCKHPEKRRYSLEALGVDCNILCEKLFAVPLLWYKDKHAPRYTSVVCGLPLKKKSDDKKVIAHLTKTLK